jgi:hypothetical protein
MNAENPQPARTIQVVLLAACLMMAVGLLPFLWRQVVGINAMVTQGKQQIREYEVNAQPKVRWFVENLQNFAKTNPDFAPILAKYNLLTPTAPPPATKK